LATFPPGRASGKNPASAPNTRKNAASGFAAGLRAGIRHALDVSRLPKSGFVDLQIATHREYQTRMASQASCSERRQAAMARLEGIATYNKWSGRKLAAKIGITERTLRRIKSGDAADHPWLAKLESAVVRLSREVVA
jgi:hypothetical protein